MRETLGPGGQPISRSGSARSFNTTFGQARPPATPSPRPPRANLGQGGNNCIHIWCQRCMNSRRFISYFLDNPR